MNEPDVVNELDRLISDLRQALGERSEFAPVWAHLYERIQNRGAGGSGGRSGQVGHRQSRT